MSEIQPNTNPDNPEHCVTSMMTEESSLEDVPEDSADQQDDSKARFHVDKTLIPSAQLAEMKEDSDLVDLGLTVFNQEDFEEGNYCTGMTKFAKSDPNHRITYRIKVRHT
jgi:hypothetical protein